MDSEVKVTTVYQGMSLVPGHIPQRVMNVTYYVGAHGPFQLQYALSDFSDSRVQADIQKQVDTLRNIGALSS
jgi:hypothetical protein